jgi:hypothetical protein
MADGWLRSAALDSLHELYFAGHMRQRLPQSIFRCSNTLRVATLARCRLLDGAVFQGLHFPHLKMLGLENVVIPDLSLQILVDGCPVLEFLLVHIIPGFRRLRINSLTLTSICVRVNGPNASTAEPHSEELIIETAPRLERLTFLYAILDLDVSVFAMPKVEALGILTEWHNFYTGLVSCSRLIGVINHSLCTCLKEASNQHLCHVYDYRLMFVFHDQLRNCLLLA